MRVTIDYLGILRKPSGEALTQEEFNGLPQPQKDQLIGVLKKRFPHRLPKVKQPKPTRKPKKDTD